MKLFDLHPAKAAVVVFCSVLLPVAVVAGCMRAAEDVTPTNAYRVDFGTATYVYVSVFTDPATGCEYWMTDDGFMSPRLNPDGAQRCAVRARS